ncbi:hypothetical protein OG292_14740 [Streptomyces sp. NBC_01511]|uniref:hypothetical protein n=1 Tax=Streptomyces sp. NBC_01511 TaxID=2903889 RepID=UPI0038655DA6
MEGSPREIGDAMLGVRRIVVVSERGRQVSVYLRRDGRGNALGLSDSRGGCPVAAAANDAAAVVAAAQ